MTDLRTILLTLALAAVAPQGAMAGPPPADPAEDPLMVTAGFLRGHPDLQARLQGLEAMKNGDATEAFKYFQRASFHADKASQGMVGEMLWEGRGVARNRPLAYAWMDLAAERGYRNFAARRELYWRQLTPEEQQTALKLGEDVYATYGDDVAKPRLASVLRRERQSVTGSRTGFVGSLQIYIPGTNSYQQIDGSRFHDRRYWDPEEYFAWQDSVWMNPRIGHVDVGEVEKANAPEAGSRVPRSTPEADAPRSDDLDDPP